MEFSYLIPAADERPLHELAGTDFDRELRDFDPIIVPSLEIRTLVKIGAGGFEVVRFEASHERSFLSVTVKQWAGEAHLDQGLTEMLVEL